LATSFPQIYVTGPVHCWTQTAYQVGLGTPPQYLGTCEVQPQVQIQQMSLPVRNDKGGPTLPMQQVDNGEMAQIGLALNYFSREALDALKSGTVSTGRRSRWSRGQLLYGARTAKLWLVFDNALEPNFRTTWRTLETGWYFPQVQFLAEAMPRIGGGKDEVRLLTLEAQPYYTPVTGTNSYGYYPQAGDQEWLLYSTADADFPDAVKSPM
jgi:hypothetical protein